MRRIMCAGTMVCGLLIAAALPAEGHGEEDFSKVRTVLRRRCQTCHNPEERRGDLDVSSPGAIEAGSASGPVVVPGEPTKSLLYTAAAHLEDPVMPPNSPRISARELNAIKSWIESLAVAEEPPAQVVSEPEPVKATDPSESGNPAAGITEGGISGLGPVQSVIRPGAVTAVAANPQQPLIAYGLDQQAVLVRSDSGEVLGSYPSPEGSITAMRFSPDGTKLFLAYGTPALSGMISVIELASGETVSQIADELDSILAMDVSPDGRVVAVGGPSRYVRLYSVRTGEVLQTLRKHTDWVLSLQFSPDGLLLASGDRFGAVIVWNPADGSVFRGLKGHSGSVNSVAWDGGSETLITAGADAKISVWNMHHGEQTATWEGGGDEILDLVPDHRGGVLVAGRDMRVTGYVSPDIIRSEVSMTSVVTCLAQAASDGKIIAGTMDGRLLMMGDDDLKTLHEIDPPVDETGAAALLAAVAEPTSAPEYAPPVVVESGVGSVLVDPEKSNMSGVTASSTEPLRGEIQALQESTVAALQDVDSMREQLSATLAGLDQIRSRLSVQAEQQAELLIVIDQILADRQAEADDDAVRKELRKTLQARLSWQEALLRQMQLMQQTSTSLPDAMSGESAEAARQLMDRVQSDIGATQAELEALENGLSQETLKNPPAVSAVGEE